MDDIRIIFVLPNGADDESEASQIMIQAYESCKQWVKNISWIKEDDLSTLKLTKLDYLVFENFEGKDFSKYIESKCAVLGPLGISVCLMEGKPIPSFQWPILNVAMYGCEVTCSQLSKSEKEAIKNKVQLMGGLYTGDLTDSITHLVCNGVNSKKYLMAAEKGAKLMLPGWINHIFEASQSSNVSATDLKILEKFKCPPLHNLTICSTGIKSSKEKTKLSEIISANGGTLTAKLTLSKTNVLICHETETTSDKYIAARKTEHIACVTADWIYDSAEKGYALPYEEYHIKPATSTPTKEGENIDPNFSTISAIGGMTLQKTHINATMQHNDDHNTINVEGLTKRISNKRKADDDLVEKIDIKKVKNAGSFLDGCSVFVVGFSPTRRDKLNKIINISGATRYDTFSRRVSHVIVGDISCPEVTSIKGMGVQCSLVSVQWLLDSVEQQKPAVEEKYLVTNTNSKEVINETSTGSPLSKKVLSFLREDITLSANDEDTPKVIQTAPDNDDPLTQKYLKNAAANKEEEDTLAKLLGNQDNPITFQRNDNEEFSLRTRSLVRQNNFPDGHETIDFRPNDASTQISQVTTDISDIENESIFKSCKFILIGFDKETADIFKSNIDVAGGTIVDKRFKGVCDYAVCPVIYKPEKLPPVQEIVNELWLVQSIENKSLCTDIEYYHRPIESPSTSPLQGCVITISGYAGLERDFLKYVIEDLGGKLQEQFSRKIVEVKNVVASTHLVSSEPNGKKYEAAIKWNIPVTTKSWLMECAKSGKRVPVEQFLIGESKSPDNSSSSAEISSKEQSKPGNKSSSTSPVQIKEVINKPIEVEQNVSTPKAVLAQNDAHTPLNQIYKFNQKSTPDACSQVTPINKILQEAINNKVLPTPPSPKTYFPWNPKTPDTPIGAFITPNPSPRLRKEMQKYVNSFPEFVPSKRRLSTPLSELKKRLMDKVLGRGEYSQTSQEDDGPSTQDDEEIKGRQQIDSDVVDDKRSKTIEEKQPSLENIAVHQKLQELQQRVMASGSSSATRRSSRMFEASSKLLGIEPTNVEIQSQVCTVGWDYGEERTQKPQQKIFLLSGIEPTEREQLAMHLKNLGAEVSGSSNYDASATHLICLKPGRNEKTLACMAAGKWILHVSYIEKSVEAGQFLDEEIFEFGNPKSRSHIPYEENYKNVHLWRKEIGRRGYRAFNDMRAIVIAEKKEPIVNVIEAGGGVIVNVSPPFDDSIHATHCLLEIKMVKDFSKYEVLAQQGIKCVNTIYINDFLWRIKRDDIDYIIPHFSQYYK